MAFLQIWGFLQDWQCDYCRCQAFTYDPVVDTAVPSAEEMQDNVEKFGTISIKPEPDSSAPQNYNSIYTNGVAISS